MRNTYFTYEVYCQDKFSSICYHLLGKIRKLASVNSYKSRDFCDKVRHEGSGWHLGKLTTLEFAKGEPILPLTRNELARMVGDTLDEHEKPIS